MSATLATTTASRMLTCRSALKSSVLPPMVRPSSSLPRRFASSSSNAVGGSKHGRNLPVNGSTYRHASSAPTASPTSRAQSQRDAYYAKRNRSLLLYSAAVLTLGVGVTYAAVPLYRMFCSATGYGGTPMTAPGTSASGNTGRFSAEKLIPFLGDDARKERKIKVTFNADCSDALPWKFTPLQREVRVRPGESALAFYTATNRSKKDIIGIATYNVTPNNVAPYFAKVECFCFEEQRLLAGEEVDLPILFFIDRDFVDDPSMRDVDDVVLSYTFFRAKRDDFGNLVPDTASD